MEFSDSNEKLPSNWIKKGSKSHPDKFYYHNIVTKKSVWKISELPMQTTNKEKSKLTSPNKQYASISHGSRTIKKNIAEDRLKKLNMVLSKEVFKEKKLTQNNATTSESPSSVKKNYTQSLNSRHSSSTKPVAKKNLAQQRLKNFTSILEFESEQAPASSSTKRKLEKSVNDAPLSAKRLSTNYDSPEIFIPNRSVTSDYNYDSFTPKRSVTRDYNTDNSARKIIQSSTTRTYNNDNFTPNRSVASNYATDNSARKILHSSRKTVQDRLNISSDVFMMDISDDITTEETDDKMEWEEIPVQKIVEKVQKVRNNPDISSMSSDDKVRTSHRNVQHSEDHFYCVIDTNVFLSNLDFIKTMIGKNFRGKSKHDLFLYNPLN